MSYRPVYMTDSACWLGLRSVHSLCQTLAGAHIAPRKIDVALILSVNTTQRVNMEVPHLKTQD